MFLIRYFAARLASVFGLAVFVLATLATSCTQPAHAQPAGVATTATFTVGADAWHIASGPARYLPDYSTPQPWRSTAAWATVSASAATDTPLGMLTVTAQARAHQVTGNRVDRLDADLRVTDATGLRVGMLPYRISWCRTYDASSPWLAEPDAFCRFSGLNEIATGAFGAQAYTSAMLGSWLVDAMAGAYRPLVDGQTGGLGPYVSVGPTVLHHAHGASVNGLHLPTGLQLRAGWLQTLQHQNSSTGSWQRRLDYQTTYLAAEGAITPRITLRASLAAYVGNQTNPANLYGWDGRSTTLEAIYKPAPGHTLALGQSRYVNATAYATRPYDQRLVVPSTTLAWRADLPAQWYAVAQATHSQDDYHPRTGPTTYRTGTAYGLRLGRVF